MFTAAVGGVVADAPLVARTRNGERQSISGFTMGAGDAISEAG